jgi:hypothetical protein
MSISNQLVPATAVPVPVPQEGRGRGVAGRPMELAIGLGGMHWALNSLLLRLKVLDWKGYKIPQVIEAVDTAQTWRTGHAVDSRTGAAGASPLCAAGAARPGHRQPLGGRVTGLENLRREVQDPHLCWNSLRWCLVVSTPCWRWAQLTTFSRVQRAFSAKSEIFPRNTYFVGTKFSSPSLWLLRYIQSIFD